MGKIIDITSKLDFDVRPVIKIKDTEIIVNADATTMFKMLDVAEEIGTSSFKEIKALMEIVFDKEEKEKLMQLDLSVSDLGLVVTTAMDLMLGRDTEEESAEKEQ